LQVDDSEQVFFAQSLDLGYPIPQPPLYTWIMWFIFKIFGAGLGPLTFIKYFLIYLTFIVSSKISNRIFNSQSLSNISTFSILLLPSFFWHMHQGFTHTILLGFAILMTFHSLILLNEESTIKNYIYFGIAVSIGLLSKYSFLFFLLPLIVSTFFIKSFRKRLLDLRIFLSISIIVLITAPHFLWLVDNFSIIFPIVDQKLNISSQNQGSFLRATFQILTSGFGFITPFIFFAISWVVIGNKKLSAKKDTKEPMKLLNIFFLIIFSASLLFALSYEINHIKVRWLHPFLLLFPIWLTYHISLRYDLDEKIKRIFYYLLLSLSGLVMLVRLIQVTFAPDIGYYGRINIPIPESLKDIPLDLVKNSTLATKDNFIGSHLLSEFDQNSIIIGKNTFRKKENNKNCLWIWDNDQTGHFFDPVPNLKAIFQKEIVKTSKEKTYIMKMKLVENCPP